MAKLHVSQADKMRIQTLREQGLGAKAIKAVYPLDSGLVSMQTAATLNINCSNYHSQP